MKFSTSTLLAATAALTPLASAISTNLTGDVFQLDFTISSLGIRQGGRQPNDTSDTSYISFGLSEAVSRLLTDCANVLPANSTASIADNQWHACSKFQDGEDYAFKWDGTVLSINSTFADTKGAFTTDCGTVKAHGAKNLYDYNPIIYDRADGQTLVFNTTIKIPFKYEEIAPGAKKHCPPKRLGGPY